MTDPCIPCIWCNADPTTHLAMLAALWEAAADNESAPWNEAEEARMSFHAETYDHETGQSRRLRRTR